MATRNWDFYIRLLSYALILIAACIAVNIAISLTMANLTALAFLNPSHAAQYLDQIDFYSKVSLTVGVVEAGILFCMGFLSMGAKSN